MFLDKIAKILGRSEVMENASYKAELENRETQRLLDYSTYWDLYKGDHWSEYEVDLDSPTPVINKTKNIVNMSISFLVGNPFIVNYADEEVEKLLSPIVNYLLKSSGKDRFSMEALQIGSVTGDCFIRPTFDKKKNKVVLQVLDSSQVFVQYNNVDYENNIPDEYKLVYKIIEGDKVKTKIEYWTAEEVIIFVDDVEVDRRQNLMKKVPLVHIRNQLCGKEVYGVSDIRDLESIQKTLNKSVRQFMDNVDYVGNPTTVLLGCKLSNLERGANKVWALPKDSDVKNLEISSDMPAHQKFIEYMTNALHELGNSPKELSNGDLRISNTSGVALHYTLLPAIMLADRKIISYKHGFETAIRLALELMLTIELSNSVMAEAYPGYKSVGIIQIKKQLEEYYKNSENKENQFNDWNDVNIDFEYYLPKDKITELEIASREISLGLDSRKNIMKRMGKDNIEKLLEEIDEERKKYEVVEEVGGSDFLPSEEIRDAEGEDVGKT